MIYIFISELFFMSGIIICYFLYKIFFSNFRTCLSLDEFFESRNGCHLGWRGIRFHSWLILGFSIFSFFNILGHADSDVDVLCSTPILHRKVKFAKIKYFYWYVFWKITFSQNECWNIFLKFNFQICFLNLSVIET